MGGAASLIEKDGKADPKTPEEWAAWANENVSTDELAAFCKSLTKKVEKETRNLGTSTLELQQGLFRILQGAAYRCYKEKYAADFHTHESTKPELPYTLENFANFVEACFELLKSLGVMHEDCHAIYDDLVASVRAEVERASGEGPEGKQGDEDDENPNYFYEGFHHPDDDEEKRTLKDDLNGDGKVDKWDEGIAFSRESHKVIIRESEDKVLTFGTSCAHYWYNEFMPKLLACVTVSTKEDAEKQKSGAFLNEADLDAWYEKAKAAGDFRKFGQDVVGGWDRLKGKTVEKLSVRRAWRMSRGYLNGPQKLREREAEGNAHHRTTGNLSQYVPFIDIHLGRLYIKNEAMRVTFPYFIGNAAWRWMHTVAEIACESDMLGV